MSESSWRTIWVGFVRGALGTGAAVAGRAIGSLILNKLVALYGGSGGLTALAQFQNLMGLFSAVPADGIQVGATARLAPLRPGSGRYRAWLGATIYLTAAAVIIAGLVLFFTGGAQWPVEQVCLFTAAMLLVTWQSLLTTALLAAGRRGVYIVQSLALSLVGTGAAAAMLAAGKSLRVVLLAYVIGQAITLPLAVLAAYQAGMLRGLRPLLPIVPAARTGLLRFVLIALGGLFFNRGVDYGVRTWLLVHFGAATDWWQAVAKLSDAYTPIVAIVLSTVFYPRLAALAKQPAAARRYLGAIVGLLALSLTLGLGLVYVLRDWLLPLLFAPRLLTARTLLGPQLFGDWAKFLSWVLLYPLLTRAQPLPHLIVQVVVTGAYIMLLIILLPRYGLLGVVWAHAGSYWLQLLGCLIGTRWR